MSQTRFTLKDLFYFVTLLCVLAAVCQLEGGAILAVCAIFASVVVVLCLRNIDVRQVWRDLAQILRELTREILAIRIGIRDLFYYFILLLVLVGVSIIEEGFIIASFGVVTSALSIVCLRCKKYF